MQLHRTDQEAMLAELAAMPTLLAAAFGRLPAADLTLPGPGGAFSPVEHCWHLADLEREGYGVRIERLLAESAPALPDFDGARIARERNYRAQSLAEGIAAFGAARAANLARLRAVSGPAWLRAGTQDGVGPVALCDLPAMMAEHDAGHRAEIDAWLAAYRATHPGT
ncbi:MAG TPA: DinB family protein [Candidatus Udaeobacter sp.]|nr:DinB family protein [Candidatus Udaeobacter sp.]